MSEKPAPPFVGPLLDSYRAPCKPRKGTLLRDNDARLFSQTQARPCPVLIGAQMLTNAPTLFRTPLIAFAAFSSSSKHLPKSQRNGFSKSRFAQSRPWALLGNKGGGRGVGLEYGKHPAEPPHLRLRPAPVMPVMPVK